MKLPFKQIKVYRWMSDNNKKIYIFNEQNDIKPEHIYIKDVIIYNDDTIENAINKIGLAIKKNDGGDFPIYAWTKEESLLFDIVNVKWSGYNINPFKSINRNSKEINETVSYDYKYHNLFNYSSINILFSSDNDTFNNNKYYFNKSIKVNTLDYYVNKDKKINLLNNIDNSFINKVSEKYHRIDLQYKLKTIKPLSIIFDNLHTSNLISLIQWVNDSTKVLYKLYKKHRLSPDIILKWSNLENVSKIQCIYLYSILANGTYCKIIIDNTGLITYSYIIDLRQGINWKQITKNRDSTKKILENAVKSRIKLNETSLKLNVNYEIDNSSITVLSKKLGEHISIFHVNDIIKEKDKTKILTVYKRSSNYSKDPIDLSEYIKSRINLGINKNEIVHELVNLNISNEDANELIDNEIDLIKRNVIEAEEKKEKRKISDTGTIVSIESSLNGYSINIINLPNRHELNNLLYWLSRIISSTRNPVKKPGKKQQLPPPKKESPKKESPEKSPDNDESPNLGEQDFDIDDIEIGGALGKDNRGYYVKMLHNADKELFKDNYARKCQAVDQPVVLTPEHKKELEEKHKLDLSKYFDNLIEYGSSKDNQNFYGCPKLWCPQSKIPLDIKDENAKCPIENEEPMLNLFQDGDKTKPRYVKLIKKKDSDICIPCCYKRKQGEDDIKKCKDAIKYKGDVIEETVVKKPQKKDEIQEVEIDEIKSMQSTDITAEDNYLFNTSAPIIVGRYGVIPESLHKLVYPKVSFALCSKTLNKSQKCLVRKGINHKALLNSREDSLLHTLAYLLNFSNKKDFIKDIRKRLDIITFISLENGNVCKSFMSKQAIIPNDNKKIKMLNRYLNTNEKIKNLLDLNRKIEPNYQLSRLLNIFDSYNKYIDYLASDDYPLDKSPYYLYSLMSILYKVLLVVWEKHDKNDINIQCPYYLSFQDIISEIGLNPNVIMLLKDNKYYEPLELKLRSDDSEKLISLKNYPNIKKVINECNLLKKTKNVSDMVYNNLYTYETWVNSKILKSFNKFSINKILLNDDLTINKFMTKGHILLITETINISYLPTLIKELGIKKVLFNNDIKNTSYDINVLVRDLEIFSNKCHELNINFNLGKNKEEVSNDKEFYSKLKLTKTELNNNQIINTRLSDPLYINTKNNNERDKKWYQLQKLVASTIIKQYDDQKLKELMRMTRKESVDELMKLFTNINKEKNKLKIILEEIPLQSIKHIKKWLNNLILYSKYDYHNKNVIEEDKEFLYSQNAIVDGIPNILILYHPSKPNKDIDKDVVYSDFELKDDNDIQEDRLPQIFLGARIKLSNKWISKKKSKWVNMVVLKHESYNYETLPEFIKWFSNKIGINVSYDEIKNSRNNKLYETIANDDLMTEMLDDSSYFNEWTKVIKKKPKTVKIFMTEHYSKLNNEKKLKLLNEIINKNELYPNDLDILAISELLNITILVIHRVKSGTGAEKERNTIDDLVISSTLYPAKKNMDNRPFLIFNKTNDKNKSIYNLVIENSDKIGFNNLILQYKDVSSNIKVLIDAHLNNI